MEQEVRAIIQIDSKKTNPEFLSLRLSTDDLIDEIIISPRAGFEFQLQLSRLLEEMRMENKIKDGLLFPSNSRKTAGKPTSSMVASYRASSYRVMTWK